MGQAGPFDRYRGDGKAPDGSVAVTPGERGSYVPSEALRTAVNTALAVEQPLLVTGEAGTGKTVLAFSIGAELGLPVKVFTVRSDHQGRDILYEFDNLARFYDAQVHDPKALQRKNYLRLNALGEALTEKREAVVLIDEIDKAPRDFPNDLLGTLDKKVLEIPELGERAVADPPPIVVITSNRESQLPDPFLRRCVFHHIEFPDANQLRRILAERLGELRIEDALLQRAVARFLEIRALDGLQKKPATHELITWIKVLQRAAVPVARISGALKDLPFPGTLLKTREDLERMTHGTS